MKPGKSHVRIFTVGKGDKSKGEKVYRRKDIVICKATENWYKEGRVVKVTIIIAFFILNAHVDFFFLGGGI